MSINYTVVRQTVELATKSGVRFALVARRTSLQPGSGLRDIDLLVAPRDLPRLSSYLISQLEIADFRLINVVRNDYSEQLYFQGKHGLLHIDLMPRLTYRGIEFLELPLNDDQVEESDGAPVVLEPWLVTYSVLRNLLWSGKLDKRYSQRLDDVLANPEQSAILKQSLVSAVGHRASIQILEDIKDPGRIATRIGSVRRNFIWRQLRGRPLLTISGVLRHYYLLTRRFLQYPGLMVVLLAHDGSGKTAILDGLEAALDEYGVVLCHSVESSLTSRGATQMAEPGGDSHRKSHRNFQSSFLAACQRYRDTTLGSKGKLWKQLEENRIVLVDRSCCDPFIDFSRRRYHGGEWLARCLFPLTPYPDLWFLLNQPLEGSYGSDQQTPGEEKMRQFGSRLSSVNSTSNHLILDASQATDAVVADAYAAIIDTLAQRAAKRLKSRF